MIDRILLSVLFLNIFATSLLWCHNGKLVLTGQSDFFGLLLEIAGQSMFIYFDTWHQTTNERAFRNAKK